MGFKKLALVTAIAAAPLAAYSMDEIQDETLSGVTGQDGLSVILNIGTNGIQTDVYIHDKDGISIANSAGTTYSFDGAIVINDMSIGVGGANITINIDAGDSAATTTSPVLNVNVGLPNTLTVVTGAIQVANSERDQGSWGVGTLSATIMNTMTIILGGTTLNIQLGNEAQTGSATGSDMININAQVNGGILIGGFRLNDASASGDGGIGATSVTVTDVGGTNLTLKIDANATDAGLIVGLAQVGAAATGMTINIVDQYFGTSTNAKIGDLSIVGLNLNGSTLTITGK